MDSRSPATASQPWIRPLTEAEIDAYDVLPPDVAARVRVIRVPDLPGRYTGMSLGRFVLLAHPVPADGWSMLLCHELVHVRQWHELGVPRFAWRYLRDFTSGMRQLRNWNRAYLGIRAEVEARELSREWMRLRNAQGPPPDAA